MERYELLRERYEDARFFLLAENFIIERAKQLTAENDRLKSDPCFIMPQHLLENGLKIIQKGRRKAQNRRTAARIKWGVHKIALICFLAALLITAACALSPSLRIQIRNLVVEITEISMHFRDDGESHVSAEPERLVLMGYILPELPKDFLLSEEEEVSRAAWIQFEDGHGNIIRFTVSTVNNTDFGVDTEDAVSVESIQIGNYACTVIAKDNMIRIYFADDVYGNFIGVEAVGLSEDVVATFVRQITHE